MKIDILGIKIDNVSLFEAKDLLIEKIVKKEPYFVVTPNAEFIVEAQNHAEFRKTMNHADLAIPDGQGLIWASKILGKKPVITERVTGVDLAEQLLIEAGKRGWKVGVVGARRGDELQINTIISNLKFQISNLEIDSLDQMTEKESQNQSFDLILACQGMKKQEKWIVENRNKIKATVFMGIGGSLDLLAGITRRAPLFFRKMGLEWLWRVIQKPSHIKRVARAVEFGIRVIREKIRISKFEIRNKLSS